MTINDTTVKRIIKRLFNTVIDEETKLRKVLSMETNDEHPESLFSGLYARADQHLEQIVKAQNKIVLLQNLINPE